MNLRNKTSVAVLALLALLAAVPAMAGHDSDSDSDSGGGGGGGGRGKCKPGGNLKIQAVFVGSGLEIIGENFDVGNGPFEVTLAGIALTVNSAGGTTIDADLPAELPIPGQYLLEVSNGKRRGKCQYDEFDMIIASVPCPCADSEITPLFAAFVAGDPEPFGIPLDGCFLDSPAADPGVVVTAGEPVIGAGLGGEGELFCADVAGGIGPITAAEGAACEQLLIDTANEVLGIPCVPFDP